MKNYKTNNIISGKEIYHRKLDYTCGLCKNNTLPDSIFNKREIRAIMTKFKMNQTDLSTLINKCNCTEKTPKVHKLCLLLNIIYNISLKCPECKGDSEYNIGIRIYSNPGKKFCNIFSLILVLLLNLLIYGACAFLILYPLIIKKDEYSNNFEKKKYSNAFYFFGVVFFLINTYFIYITFSAFLIKNPIDSNSYALEVKDRNDQNKKKNNRNYNLLYRFFRYFYQSQIRYLITRKQRYIFIAKGYGYYNKELQDMIIKNNIACEKELEENNNGGDEILGLKINKINNNNNNLNKEENNINNINEKSNGNIDNNNNSGNEEESKNNEDKNSNYIKKISSNKKINSNKNNDLLAASNNNIDKQSKSKKSIDTSKKSITQNSLVSDEILKEKKKNIVIEIVNTDKPNIAAKNISLGEERKNQDTESNNSKKSGNNLIKNMNKKNDKGSRNSKDKNNKKIDESKQSLNNNKEERKESSNKIQLIDEPNIFNDDDDLFISTPFHNNGK